MSYIYKYPNAVSNFAANQQSTIKITANDVGLSNGPKEFNSPQVGQLLGTAYFLAGIVAVLVIVIGGVRYVASNGDSGQVQSAKNMVTYAIVGLVVIIMAAAITQFVITFVTK